MESVSIDKNKKTNCKPPIFSIFNKMLDDILLKSFFTLFELSIPKRILIV